MKKLLVCVACCLSVCVLLPLGASAQSYSGDARRIAMGGIGSSGNIASKMIEDEREYRSIVIPLGLLQLLSDKNRFDPDSDQFDPILAMEYAASPLHFTFGRRSDGAQGDFVSDVVNGEEISDLSKFHGFVPTNHLKTDGLANPNWGKTFKFHKRPDGSFHGVYVGAGPYLSAGTDLNIDKELTDILANAATQLDIPEVNAGIRDRTAGQVALDIIGGYRGRFALPVAFGGDESGRNGIYVGANYHFLRGFRYEDVAIGVQFETYGAGPSQSCADDYELTDCKGLVKLNPGYAPVTVDYLESKGGSGYAFDFGVGVVRDQWEFGFGANGVGNKITWNDLALRRWQLDNWGDDGDFAEVYNGLPPTPSKVEMSLPVEYAGNVAYRTKTWTALGEISHGFGGTGLQGGGEYRRGRFEFRGGLRYGLSRWHPTGGVGVDITPGMSIDAALYASTTNIARHYRPAFAVSLRFNRPKGIDE